MGAMLPFILKRLGFDPAGSSTPFVATLVDVTGIVIYFTCAMLVLSTTLLRPDAPDKDVHTSIVARVVSVDGYKPGDDAIDLTIQTEEQKARGASSHVSVKAGTFKGTVPPAPGDRLVIDFVSQDAAGARPAEARP
jgi:hypothetical protein